MSKLEEVKMEKNVASFRLRVGKEIVTAGKEHNIRGEEAVAVIANLLGGIISSIVASEEGSFQQLNDVAIENFIRACEGADALYSATGGKK